MSALFEELHQEVEKAFRELSQHASHSSIESDVIHRMSNYLQMILGNLEMALACPVKSEMTTQYIKQAMVGVNGATTYIHQIRETLR